MEVQFKEKVCGCMDPVVSRVLSSEQTQEIRLGDGMPDVGYIIGAWGQSVLRSKEWHDSFFSFSGGMMVWILYAPEDGSEPRTVSSWIPFHFRWELPPETPEGVMCMTCRTRFVDARSVSPGKIMVRAGLSVLGEALVPREFTLLTPEGESGSVQMNVVTYPVMMVTEAGEKAFELDEELKPPESLPVMKELAYCALELKNAECRVLSDKLAFRGTLQLHLVYRSESGQFHAWDYDIPFSQFSELKAVYGTESAGDISLCITSLEPELTEEGKLRIKCGLVAQYRIREKESVCIAEDAFDPTAELMIKQEELLLPVMLDQGKRKLPVENTVNVNANVAVDACLLADFPTQSRDEEQAELEYPGSMQLLYYGEDGKLHGIAARWEGRDGMKLHPQSLLTVIPEPVQLQSFLGSGNVLLKGELPVRYAAATNQRIVMLKGIQKGQPRQPDPNRPSLILRRCGEESLWEIAKSSGASVEQIRRANNLEGECVSGTLLMIPIP